MNQHRSVACPRGTGGEYNEHLYNEQTQCNRCHYWFNDAELQYSKTLAGYYCNGCFKHEEHEHYHSEDYEGEEFE